MVSASATVKPDFGIERDEVPGERISEAATAASPVFCGRGDAAAKDRSRGFGLSLGFENDGLGSSLGAGDGSTFAGVL